MPRMTHYNSYDSYDSYGQMDLMDSFASGHLHLYELEGTIFILILHEELGPFYGPFSGLF